MDQSDADDYLINKETLYPGTKYIPFVDGTRVSALQVFAFRCVFDWNFPDFFFAMSSFLPCRNNALSQLILDQISLSDTNMSRVW